MRAAAAIAVLLLVFSSACSSDDSIEAPLPGPPASRLPDPTLDRDSDFEPGLDVVDLTDWEDRTASAYDRPTPCTIPPTALAGWADENLGCGTCFALMCDGDVYAHVCTHRCESTRDPAGDQAVPLI